MLFLVHRWAIPVSFPVALAPGPFGLSCVMWVRLPCLSFVTVMLLLFSPLLGAFFGTCGVLGCRASPTSCLSCRFWMVYWISAHGSLSNVLSQLAVSLCRTWSWITGYLWYIRRLFPLPTLIPTARVTPFLGLSALLFALCPSPTLCVTH